MSIADLAKKYPKEFAYYADKVLDSYFGNIFVSWKNHKILYVNAKMAASIHMKKEDLENMTLEELRSHKFWMRSLSKELYERKEAFDGYNVSKWGNELFTHVEPIFDENGEVVMSAQFSIPKEMLNSFSLYVNSERSNMQKYKDILEYLNMQHKNKEETLVHESPISKELFVKAYFVGQSGSTVLICGETGTGKDVMANYIYNSSTRADRPFVPVNCSAIPSELFESEFFGYEKGAFTGAHSTGKAGLFEMADKGTLFLDEIGEVPLSMQAKLLRVLETGEIRRLGGTKIIRTDVRIIAATNQDLKKLIAEHRFREDLYYRLNIMTLYLPPLRERKEDILPLSHRMLEKFNYKYGLNRVLTPKMCGDLLSYKWFGNIRELRNVIERYAISGYMSIDSLDSTHVSKENFAQTALTAKDIVPLHEACGKFESNYINEVLGSCGGSVTKAANLLGIHRSLLYKKIQKYKEKSE